jgi:hypothetical protein
MSVKLRCKDGMGNIITECQYGTTRADVSVTGGTPVALLTANAGLQLEGGTCNATATWTGSYFFEKQKPLWVFN